MFDDVHLPEVSNRVSQIVKESDNDVILDSIIIDNMPLDDLDAKYPRYYYRRKNNNGEFKDSVYLDYYDKDSLL